jgi:CheY-like chemotaxis protein
LEVIVVDDDPVSRDLLRMVLESTGHTVQECGDAGAALELVRRVVPPLVITDLSMGRTRDEGYGLVAEIHGDAALGATAIVALTGVTRAADLERARALGADLCLAKPFNVHELLAFIDKL